MNGAAHNQQSLNNILTLHAGRVFDRARELQGLSREEQQLIRTRAQISYNYGQQAHQVIVTWATEEGGMQKSVQRMFPDRLFSSSNGIQDIKEELAKMADSVDFRAEVFYAKLAKRIPKLHGLVREGTKVTIQFRNGRTYETTEDKLEADETLAACAMIFDL